MGFGTSTRVVVGSAIAGGKAHSSIDLLDRLYSEHFSRVWRILRRLGVPDAQLDDASQDVFMVVHRRLSEFDIRRNPRALLAAITLRVARNHRRTLLRKRDSEELSPALVDLAPDPSQRAAASEAVRQVQTILDSMEEQRRTVLVLADLEEMSGPEIAEALAVKLNTVYSRLRVARSEFNAAALALQKEPDE